MDKVRICRIQVKNLFGNINYDIDLGEGNPIAIITAPNGRGKTTILNLISFVLNPVYDTFSVIRSIPFDDFRCILSNGRTVELRQIRNGTDVSVLKRSQDPRRPISEQALMRAKAYFENTDFEFVIHNGSKRKRCSMLYSETLRDAFEMDPTEYLDENDDDFILPYRRQSPPLVTRLEYIWKVQKHFLEDSGCIVPVNFIKADRIQPIMHTPRTMRDYYDEPRQESPLERASESITESIKNATERYNEAVSQAKDKLPQMFLDGEGSDLDCDEFMKGWFVYRKELNQFQKIGLITPTEDFTLGKDISKVYKEKGTFLSTYLSAFKDTTVSLKDIYRRLNLFKQTLDERNAITGKKIVFGRDGISLSIGDRDIKLDTLSSGEKHDFIMFYNLIFNISANGLVLIDEPEISLHIEWQETYLDKLIAICEMNGLQAIVATHSPNIVSSHYDFLVDKGETNG
ncbi:AAA family ATPase [Succinimonas sp.]|uniref:AAA family ATPase n=1 Tax=Succinimonas sp. TaxID=1936151 RepID=UPI003863AADF